MTGDWIVNSIRHWGTDAENADKIAIKWGEGGKEQMSWLKFWKAVMKVRCDVLNWMKKQDDKASIGVNGISVGLCSERGEVEGVIGAIGIMSAGVSVVPMEGGREGKNRREKVLSVSGISLVVVSPKGKACFEPRVVLRDENNDGDDRREKGENGGEKGFASSLALTCLLVSLEEFQGADEDDEDFFVPRCVGNTPAYVMYTSGSTGEPKGVVVSHANLLFLAQTLERAYPLTPEDVVATWSSLAWDGSVEEVYVSLAAGCTVVLPGSDVLGVGGGVGGGSGDGGVEGYLRWVDSVEATFLKMPTGLWDAVASVVMDGEGIIPSRVHSIRVAGEAMRGAGVSRWDGRGGVVVWNAYGPTEATVHVTMCNVSEEMGRVPGPSGSLSIGVPVAGVEVALVNRAGTRRVPVGGVGEAWIGGSGVAQGYLDNKAASDACFFVDPAWGGEGRWYRSGDLMRERPGSGGRLDFIGRADGQLSLSGHRVEPGEIESAVIAFGGVDECCVVAVGSLLVAVIGGDAGGHEPGARRVDESSVETHLPSFSVPGLYVGYPGPLPRSGVSGKIDRRSVLAFAEGRVREADGAEGVEGGPSAPGAEWIAATAGKLLGREVGVWSDLKASGMTSLTGAILAGRIGRVWTGAGGLSRSVFGGKSAGAIAERLLASGAVYKGEEEGINVADGVRAGRGAGGGRGGEVMLPLRTREGVLEAPRSVGALWLAQMVRPSSVAYNIVVSVNCGDLDGATVRCRVNGLIERHEALRTVWIGPEARAVVLPRSEAAWEESTEAIETVERRQASMAFDLESGPIVRAVWVSGTREVVLAVHHSAMDGASLGVLAGELWSPVASGETAVQYLDWAAHQPASMGGELGAGELDEGLVLPESGDGAGGNRVERLSRGLGAETERDLVRCIGAWSVVLARFCCGDRGDRTACPGIATPLANRGSAGGQHVVGLVVETPVVFVPLEAGSRWSDVDELVEAGLGNGVEGPAHSMVLVQPEVRALGAVGTRAVSPLESKYNVGIVVGPGPKVEIEWDPSVWDHDMAESAIDAFCWVLESRKADEMVWDCELGVEESVLETPGRDLGPSGVEQTLIWAVAEGSLGQGREDHEVRVGDEAKSWAEVWGVVVAVAALIEESDPGAVGGVVGVYGDRGWAWLIGVLAVSVCGAGVAPIDPSWPAERAEWIGEDCGMRAVVCGPGDVEAAVKLMGGDNEAVVVVAESVLATDQRASLEVVRGVLEGSGVSGSDVCHVMYTSGSTGKPKGVVVDHAAALSSLWGFQEALNIGVGEVVSVVASVSFDVSLMELWYGAASGAHVDVHVGPVEGPEGLSEWAARRGVAVLFAPTVLFVAGARSGKALWSREPLHTMWLTGEPLPSAALDSWKRAEGGGRRCRLLNAYGPTETVVDATMGQGHGRGAWGYAGMPLAGVGIAVLQFGGEAAVPRGAWGECVIFGRQVGPGYIARPKESAKAFVMTERFGPAFRTGDVSRIEDGQLVVRGRSDRQVKVGGARVELGEVEAVVSRSTGKICAAVVHGQSIVVFVEGGKESDAEAGLSGAQAWLPRWAVPGRIEGMAKLPRTPTGKIDRRALGRVRAVGDGGGSGGMTETETRLWEVWAEFVPGVRELERLGGDVDFFEAGGHSLLIPAALSRVSAVFGVRVGMADAFSRGRTLRGFAELIEEAVSSGGGDRWQPEPGPLMCREGPIPLSSQQAFSDAFGSVSVIGRVWRLSASEWSFEKLEGCWQGACRRHEALRTVLVGEEQIVLPYGEAEFVSLEHECPPDMSVKKLAGELYAEAVREGPQEHGRMVAVRVSAGDKNEMLVVITLPHVVADGASLVWLMEEILSKREWLDGAANGVGQYADYAIWRELLEKEGWFRQRGVEHWTKVLQKAPLIDVDCLDSQAASEDVEDRFGEEGEVGVISSGELGSEARKYERGVLSAVWRACLVAWTGDWNVMDSVLNAGRSSRRWLGGAQGYYAIVTPVHMGRVSGEKWGEWVARGREASLEALEVGGQIGMLGAAKVMENVSMNRWGRMFHAAFNELVVEGAVGMGDVLDGAVAGTGFGRAVVIDLDGSTVRVTARELVMGRSSADLLGDFLAVVEYVEKLEKEDEGDGGEVTVEDVLGVVRRRGGWKCARIERG